MYRTTNRISCLLWIASGFLYVCGTPGYSDAAEAIRVGDIVITNEDIARRTAVEAAYGAKSFSRTDAAVTLIVSALDACVAKDLGLAVTPEELREFSEHADATSRAPDVLKKIKAVFGDDVAAYRHAVLEPKILREKLHAHHSRTPAIHRVSRDKIETAMARIKAGEPFPDAAKSTGLDYEVQQLNTSPRQVEPGAPENLPDPGYLEDHPLVKILDALADGQVHPQIVEDDAGYRVIRRIVKTGTVYHMETVASSKIPYSEWFESLAGDLTIHVADQELKEAVRKRIRDTWWVRMVI